jgi:hypothetical protein
MSLLGNRSAVSDRHPLSELPDIEALRENYKPLRYRFLISSALLSAPPGIVVQMILGIVTVPWDFLGGEVVRDSGAWEGLTARGSQQLSVPCRRSTKHQPTRILEAPLLARLNLFVFRSVVVASIWKVLTSQ